MQNLIVRCSMRWRLFFCFMLVVLTGLGVAAYSAQSNLRRDVISQTMGLAIRDADTLHILLQTMDITTLNQAKSLLEGFAARQNVRVTYVDHQGKVLVETGETDETAMDNHAMRKEIRGAFAAGKGQAIRASTTLGVDYVYAAQVTEGIAGVLPSGIVRVGMTYAGVEDRFMAVVDEWGGVLFGASLLSLILSYALSAHLDGSLRNMIEVVEAVAADPGAYRPGQPQDRTFSPLMAAVNDMADRINDNIRVIARQKAQLAAILDTMEEGVLVLNAEGRISLVNKALQRLFPSLSEGREPNFALPELQQALQNPAVKPGDWQEVVKLQVSPRPGQALSVQLARLRVVVHDISCVAVFHDISELVRLLHMRRDFMANVSHELRTPLTVIQGSAETLLELPVSDQSNRERFLGVIMRHATHMTSMVEDLLQLARIESGSLPMNFEPTDAHTLVSGVITHALGGFTAPRGIVVDCLFPRPEEGGLTILADSHYLGQVFRNLLENAIKHTPDNGHIVISGMRWQGRGGGLEAVFSVSDSGPGFPEDDIARVFERFYRVEKHRANDSGTPSTGLGLAICKHIVERHNGRIWAENSPGGVVRFTIRLQRK